MRKNIKILLIVAVIIILLLIPAIVFADLIRIPLDRNTVVNDEERREEKMEEKAIILNQLEAEKSVTNQSSVQVENKTNSITSQYNSTEQELTDEQQEIKDIIDKYSDKKFDKFITEIMNEALTKHLDSDVNPIFDTEVEFYQTIVNIIKTKPITNDEEEVLKQVLKDSLSKMKFNEELKTEVNSVLE